MGHSASSMLCVITWSALMCRAIGSSCTENRLRAYMEGAERDEVHLVCPARNYTIGTASSSCISQGCQTLNMKDTPFLKAGR